MCLLVIVFACDCDAQAFGIMHLGISPPVLSFRFLALSRFLNPFPNPPSLSQLSRTSVSGQISRFDQELIYKVLLPPLTTLEGGGLLFWRSVLLVRPQQRGVEMFWRCVLLTQKY